MTTTRYALDDLTVVVPARNAADLLPACLESVRANGLEHVILVDGCSVDETVEIAREFGISVLSDHGRGLPAARTMGAWAAETPLVLLLDADVVLPVGSVERLLSEYRDGRYDVLQAGLESVGGPGYWGQALAEHHRRGRSRWWLGLVATVMPRSLLLDLGFDERFRSGEDIDFRWQLQRSGRRAGVSHDVVVRHRFARDDFDFAKDQFLMDGYGLGRMVSKYGWRGARLGVLPAAAAARGCVLSLGRGEPRWIGYYAAYAWFNYAGMRRGLRR